MRSTTMSGSPISDDSATATRRSLLTRLKHWDDAEGWRQFFDRYGGLLYRFAVRSGLDSAAAQDAVQEVMLAVAKQMPGFRYDPARGSFRAWLYNQARWRIADSQRRRRRAGLAGPLNADGTTGVDEVPEPGPAAANDLEADWDREWRENQLARALELVKARVNPRQFQMFHLVAVKGWAIPEITRTLKVNRAQVYMARMRVGRLVREVLAQLEES
jgi:RNA polymerase sigma factor (sigma-70 family)